MARAADMMSAHPEITAKGTDRANRIVHTDPEMFYLVVRCLAKRKRLSVSDVIARWPRNVARQLEGEESALSRCASRSTVKPCMLTLRWTENVPVSVGFGR